MIVLQKWIFLSNFHYLFLLHSLVEYLIVRLPTFCKLNDPALLWSYYFLSFLILKYFKFILLLSGM